MSSLQSFAMHIGKTGIIHVEAFFFQLILSSKGRISHLNYIVSLAFILFFINPTSGQTSMDLSQCIDYALVHHTDVLSAHIDEEIALQNVRRVASAGYPQINAYGTFDDNIKIPLVALPAIFFDRTAPADAVVPVRFGVQYNSSAYVQLDQIIYMGTYWVGLKASKVSRVYYCQSSQQVIENTIYNVSKSYFQYLVSVQKVEVQKSNLEKSQNLFKIVDLQFKNDVATKADRDRVFVDYSNQLTELKTLQRSVKASLNQLKFQIGMPVSELVDIANVNADTTSLFNLEALAEKPNYWKRADYKLMQTKRELGALQVKQYTSEYQPQLTGFGKYQYQSFSEEFNLWKTEWFNSQVVGLRLTVPVFSGFKRSAQVQQYKLELKKTEIGIFRLEQQINIELSNAFDDFNTSVDNIRLAGENIKLAQLVYDSEILSYKEGVGAYSDFLNATNSLKVAQVNYITSLFNAYLARLELARSQGKISEVIKWIGK